MTTQGVIVGTDAVLPTEPCYHAFEAERRAPDGRSIRRYRHIRVSRGDKLAEHIVDLGPASQFKSALTNFVCGGMTNGKAWSEHTVEEAMDICDQAMEIKYDLEDLPRLRDLEAGYQAVIEQRKQRARK